MTMDKSKEIVKVLNDCLWIDHDFNPACSTIEGQYSSSENILNLFTPKLQWKSEEIRYSGGDILLSTIHTVSNYHTEIRIYEPVDGITHVAWNGHVIFEGTLDECKKFCSNKVLDDFLKLCE